MRNRNPKIGYICQFEHTIDFKCEFNPKFREYSIPLRFKEEMLSHLTELENEKIIGESETPYVSPAFMIRKKNGNIRLVVDYRELNKCSKSTHISFPKITDVLQFLK
ncbi:Retrovirus-related Pol polyprotein from transposon 17.6 [Dictyocoela muelleri]|nr:Retrovirus-related Pol polyprotein from transposon 17.6 [Dictyocoela muelleri]